MANDVKFMIEFSKLNVYSTASLDFIQIPSNAIDNKCSYLRHILALLVDMKKEMALRLCQNLSNQIDRYSLCVLAEIVSIELVEHSKQL